jgi:type IV secretory pathway VirJ component
MKRLRILFLAVLCKTTCFSQTSATPPISSGLPIIITKSKTDTGDKFVLLISGDGGWNDFSQALADSYAARGIPAIGLNSLKYFWKKKTPQQAANDVASVLNQYINEWKKKNIIICGFSFGADVAPFIYRRLPEKLRNRVELVQLVSPASFTDFEIHVSDLISLKNPVRSMDIASEVKMIDVPVICYYGNLEEVKPLSGLKKANFKTIILPGDHHYKYSFSEIAKTAGK